ncbi:hypothetical protein [Pseudonocardia nigra]|uniref:hypothetical protein n=1 Tax=Pseudonocardia nigra TaxID=1921578 RepID=UPI001C5EBE7D|nr:hypothetical protein [Pseudonocardia nigra]
MTHFGYANITGRTDEAFAHLRHVTGMTQAQAHAHVHAAQNLWIERSARVWTLDLTMLIGAGVTVRRPEHAHERPAVVDEALRQAATAWPVSGRPGPPSWPASITARDIG